MRIALCDPLARRCRKFKGFARLRPAERILLMNFMGINVVKALKPACRYYSNQKRNPNPA